MENSSRDGNTRPPDLPLVAQTVKLPPVMRETQVQSLGREDPLEKEMATHSSILAWRIPWIEEPGRLQSTGSQSVGHDRVTSLRFPSLRHISPQDPGGNRGTGARDSPSL